MKKIVSVLGKLLKTVGKGSQKPLRFLLRLFGIRNIIIVGLAVALIAVLYFGSGGGIGNGFGNGEGDGNSDVELVQETEFSTESITTDESVDLESSIEETDGFDEQYLNILVFENFYIYDDDAISLQDFILVAKQKEGKIVVEIKDKNASFNAYNDLIDALREANIKYVEE